MEPLPELTNTGWPFPFTPQDWEVSPVLANMALDGLERILRKKYPHSSARALKGMNKQVNLVRYADDFIITGISQEILETEVKPLVTSFLRERGLELSEEKTKITHIEEGFDFLGQHVRQYNGQFLTLPSKKNVKAFLTDIRKVIKGNKAATAYGLIATLNPKIRGWANFHQHAAAKKTFGHVDTAIFKALWRWARRRHPKKGKRWVKDRYFGQTGNQNWRFFGTAKDKDGQTIRNLLCLASATPVTRYTKIKGECNPYDSAWELYLETRLGVKMEKTLQGKRRLTYLWKEQGGICPVCNQLITQVTGWHNHHIVYKTHGGADSAENRVLIQPNCYKQVHAKGLTVSKPRPSKLSHKHSQGRYSMLEPDEGKLCAVSRTDGIATRGGRSSGSMTPRRTTDLDPKGRGDKSMLVKRGTAEDVYAVVLQRLSDRAKTGLFEFQSPGVEPHTRRQHI